MQEFNFKQELRREMKETMEKELNEAKEKIQDMQNQMQK